MTDDALLALMDAYETQAMMWDWRADEVEADAPPRRLERRVRYSTTDYRHQAVTCRYLAEEVRESLQALTAMFLFLDVYRSRHVETLLRNRE